MGLNYFTHLKLASDDEWSRLEHRLLTRASFDSLLKDTQLASVTVEGRHQAAPDAKIQIKAEPSTRERPGVFIATNEHYEREGVDAGRRLMDILNRRWDGAIAYARQ